MRLQRGIGPLLGHRLFALAREPFGGDPGLVDVEVDRGPLGEPVYHDVDRCSAELNPTCGASRPAALDEHTEDHPAAEITHLLSRQLELVMCVYPVPEEAAYGRPTLKGLERPLPDDVGGEEARCRVDVPGVDRVEIALRQLHNVGRRGLLGHRGRIIPNP